MNRFTDTTKWQDEWFGSLSPTSKIAYLYLLDTCDAAGVIDQPGILANRILGMDVDWMQFKEALGDRLVTLPCGKWFLVKFVRFQCPKGVNPKCKGQGPMIASIRRHDLFELLGIDENFNSIDTVSLSLDNHTHTALTRQDKTREEEAEEAKPQPQPIDEVVTDILSAAGFKRDATQLSPGVMNDFLDQRPLLSDAEAVEQIKANARAFVEWAEKTWTGGKCSIQAFARNLGEVLEHSPDKDPKPPKKTLKFYQPASA